MKTHMNTYQDLLAHRAARREEYMRKVSLVQGTAFYTRLVDWVSNSFFEHCKPSERTINNFCMSVCIDLLKDHANIDELVFEDYIDWIQEQLVDAFEA